MAQGPTEDQIDVVRAVLPSIAAAVMVLAGPLVERLVRQKATREFDSANYRQRRPRRSRRPVGGCSPKLVGAFAVWAADVFAAAATAVAPAIGLAASLGDASRGLEILFLIFALLGFVLFLAILSLDDPIRYAGRTVLGFTAGAGAALATNAATIVALWVASRP